MTASPPFFKPAQTAAGFTLVEMLVAIAVFSLVAAAGAGVLNGALNARDGVGEADGLMRQVSLARSILKSDSLQIVARPARDVFGGQTLVSFEGGTVEEDAPFLRFARRGWSNPGLIARRGTVQYVEYLLEGDRLVRRTRLRPDPTSETGNSDRVLLDGVRSVGIEFLTNGNWQQAFQTGGFDRHDLPSAMALTLDHERLGRLRQLFLITGEHP